MGANHHGSEIRPMHAKCFLSAILAALCGAPLAYADEECKVPSDDCVAIGRWNFSVALGAGVRTNPLANGTDIPLVVIPEFSYYWKRFFGDNLDLGFTLAESGTNTFNLIATPGYDRVYFYRTDLQNFFIGFPTNASAPVLVSSTAPGAVKVSPPTPHVTYLGGPEWTFKVGRVSGQLDLLRDLTGQNNGDEIRAAVGIPLIESRGSMSANAGFTWKSAATVNYYYWVSRLNNGGSALNPFLKLGYTLPLTGKWRFTAFVEYEKLGNAIAASPIVAENHVETAFVGAVYSF